MLWRSYYAPGTWQMCWNKSLDLLNLDLPGLDKKWQREWEKQRLEREKDKKSSLGSTGKQKDGEKMYILPMFPYPSGDLHIGHLRVYTISDVIARFRRMQGYKVMHPIGWDAFGLPAENAAIERGIDPAVWTRQNIQKMKDQLQAMNGCWDWEREFATCDPKFYKHTQRLFLLLHQRGLAYQEESYVNYDPVDKTVLANEQVDANGFSWRSGAKVQKRLLKQWFLRISKFRDALLDDLKYLSKDGGWPERVLAMQQNWLGKSTGAQIKFAVIAYDKSTYSAIEVFTTRPDTIFGVQYMALAASHPIVKEFAKSDLELQAFLEEIPDLPPDSKAGYLLPHVRAINPLAYENSSPDAIKASIPIYVAPYVLSDYGDGAVMGVPGHDVRDHAFWKHNRGNEPIRMVVAPLPGTANPETEPFVSPGRLTFHSGPYAGQSTRDANKNIINLLESKNLGSAAETWRLRDWLVSRQRYWGTPIPIVHCHACGPVPVPDEQLPVELPKVDGHWLKGKAGNPLEDAHDWIHTSCPSCGGPAKRDTDTMDTFVDSSWYFMRFPDPKSENVPFSSRVADVALPVDLYIGGVEHAILHLLYARFISKFIATTPLWPAGLDQEIRGEPFKQILTQGMVHGKTYSDPSTKRFLKPDEVDLSVQSNPIVIATGQKANISFEKMSKSKYNGVDPGACMAKFGADATRAHILFQAPVSEVLEWDEDKISGVTRWLRRLHRHIKIKWGPDGLMNKSDHRRSDFNPKLHLIDYVANQRYGNVETSMLANPAIDSSIKETADTVVAQAELEMKLWRTVQYTIASVTESYSRTHSLNTVISDLMALSNLIIETSEAQWKREPLTFHAIKILIQLMSPITPAFAEECWDILHSPRRSLLKTIFQGTPNYANLFRPGVSFTDIFHPLSPSIPSIFSSRFPETDETYDMLAPQTQSCAVQINGKFKFTIDIDIPPTQMSMDNLEGWIMLMVLKSKEGKKRFGSEEGKIDIRASKKVIVVKKGKLVNFVL
ncbi:hypothetical protein B7494_g4633 [Chlorociboria aeruginascens]|nr:hypothetical protein B7494_g4633 [Chlorociboria aeruginascens]